MKDIKFVDGKITDKLGRGYIMFRRYDDGIYVLMGSYTDNNFRGQGVFKNLLEKFIDEIVDSGETIEIALCNKKILPFLLKFGFNKIKEPVRHWGKISNGVNLVLKK